MNECKTDICRALRQQFGAINAAWDQISEIANNISDTKVRSMVREQAIKQVANSQLYELTVFIIDVDEQEKAKTKTSAQA